LTGCASTKERRVAETLPLLAGPLPDTVAGCDDRLAELHTARAALIDPASRQLAMLEVDRILDRRTALARRDRLAARAAAATPGGTRPNPFGSRRQAA
jgi:hypothetical protein